MLVKCYGQLWNPDIVDWGGGGAGAGKLLGNIRRKGVKHQIDFWQAKLKAAKTCAVSYADKGGKYQDQPGLTLPRVDGIPFRDGTANQH